MLPDLYISRFRGSGARSLLNRATRQRHDDCVTTTQESYRRPARRHTARRPRVTSASNQYLARMPGRRPLSVAPAVATHFRHCDVLTLNSSAAQVLPNGSARSRSRPRGAACWPSPGRPARSQPGKFSSACSQGVTNRLLRIGVASASTRQPLDLSNETPHRPSPAGPAGVFPDD
jgi:hypothetical protein